MAGVEALLLIFGLIAINGFFAASEMALVSLPPSRLKVLKEEGTKTGEKIGILMADPGRLLSTIQIGVTLAGYLASTITAVTVGESLAAALLQVMPGLTPYKETIMVLTSTIMISYLTLVGGELVPKRLALQNPTALARKVARPLIFFSKIFAPLIWFLNKSSILILKAIGLELKTMDKPVSEDELQLLVRDQPTMEKEEKEMISGVFKFGEREAQTMMTPRTEIKALAATSTVWEASKVIAETGHSRLPVYEHSLDQIIGFVSVKDLVRSILEEKKEQVTDVLRPVYYVFKTKNALELMREMREARIPLAIVVDEYGGTAGLITITDLTGEIVGEIRDEFDLPVDDQVKKIDDNQYIISGQLSLKELEKYFGLKCKATDDYETVAGFLMSALGRIPNHGEELNLNGFAFRIEALKGPKIKKIKIIIKRPSGS